MRRAQIEENKFAKFATRFDDKDEAIAAWELEKTRLIKIKNLKQKEKKVKKELAANADSSMILSVEENEIEDWMDENKEGIDARGLKKTRLDRIQYLKKKAKNTEMHDWMNDNLKIEDLDQGIE
jgi:hypothetical protein